MSPGVGSIIFFTGAPRMSSYADYDVEPEADLAAGDLPNFRVHVHDFDGCVRRLR